MSTERSDNLPKAHELKKLWSAALFFPQPKIKPGRQIRRAFQGDFGCHAKDKDFILWAIRKQRRFSGSEGTSCYEGRELGRSAWCQGCAGLRRAGQRRSRQMNQQMTMKNRQSLKNTVERIIYAGKERQISSVISSWTVSIAPFGSQCPSLTCFGYKKMDEWVNGHLFHILF